MPELASDRGFYYLSIYRSLVKKISSPLWNLRNLLFLYVFKVFSSLADVFDGHVELGTVKCS